MTRARLLIASLLAATAFGCSANVSASGSGDVADADANASTAAVIIVERTVGEAARGEATARFLRMRTRPTTDDALRVVGANVDFPATGTCISLATLGSFASSASLGSARSPEPAPPVQLLDVGTVSMEANGVQTNLLARQVPDVVDLVSGVVYARSADAELLPARARYVLRVSGAGDSDPFTVTASAPNDLGDLRVGGQEARTITMGSVASADLTWEPGAEGDMVYVDVNGAPSARTRDTRDTTVRCAFADTGRATIAAALLPDEGTLTVHRLHRERFRARGIESGEMRFDFAKVVAFIRR
jgi:hypothetical protein